MRRWDELCRPDLAATNRVYRPALRERRSVRFAVLVVLWAGSVLIGLEVFG